jgi:hypothetical protein
VLVRFPPMPFLTAISHSMRLALSISVADQKKNAFRVSTSHRDYMFSTNTQLYASPVAFLEVLP